MSPSDTTARPHYYLVTSLSHMYHYYYTSTVHSQGLSGGPLAQPVIIHTKHFTIHIFSFVIQKQLKHKLIHMFCFPPPSRKFDFNSEEHVVAGRAELLQRAPRGPGVCPQPGAPGARGTGRRERHLAPRLAWASLRLRPLVLDQMGRWLLSELGPGPRR